MVESRIHFFPCRCKAVVEKRLLRFEIFYLRKCGLSKDAVYHVLTSRRHLRWSKKISETKLSGTDNYAIRYYYETSVRIISVLSTIWT